MSSQASNKPLAAAPPAHPRRLSERLDALIDELHHGEPVQIGKIIAALRGRAYTLLLIVLAAPFCTPVPLPGISTPFGALIALIGLRLALGRRPWLPSQLLDRKVSSRKLTVLLQAARRLASSVEVILHPRWSSFVEKSFCGYLNGVIILVSGLLLLLPLPIPFTNTFPALTVVLLSAAMIERDGYTMIAGMAVFALTLTYFGGIFFGTAAVVNWLEDWFGGKLDPDLEIPKSAG